MPKKSQVTFYIIFMVIVLIILISYFVISNSSGDMPGGNMEETGLSHKETLNNYMGPCLKDTAIDGIRLMVLQGLYYDVPDPINYMMDVPLYFDNGTDNVPTKERVESELKRYIIENNRCRKNDFEGFSVEYGEMDVSSILGRTTTLQIGIHATIHDDKRIDDLENVNIDIDYDFERMFGLINDFETEHQKDPNSIPIGFLDYLNNNYSTNSTILYIDNETVLYSFDFDVVGERVPFNFAARYDWSEIYG